jgi:hypothetical protein
VTAQKSNHLVNEKSPYLLQHAHNPVDWYPWGEEAFAKARKEDKPVFLSIGYSTCHWCHVMAQESFEDEEVAGLLNQRFICIKVDREERPDLDAVYMEACQAMTGQGGWPLSVFLTPEQKPFFAGTYFPREGGFGRPGFKEIIVRLYEEYKKNPKKISEIGQKIVAALQREGKGAGELGEDDLHSCFHRLEQVYDQEYGGFGSPPKFPAPHNLMFLLRYHRWTGEGKALEMVTRTLDAMAAGGIYDHLGYGFSRYSTDRTWLVPHFEKMLYDNALLAIAYIEAWQVTGKGRYMSITREILDYVEEKMTSPQGGYYSAEDADSEGVEGKFYLWDKGEVMKALGPEQGALFCSAYDISDKGNFAGENIPNLVEKDLEEVANRHNLPLDQLLLILEHCRQKLFSLREARIHPHKDDKILTAWNGLMIVAQALAARSFGEEKYLERAKKAFAFIEKNLVADGRLMARWREGETAHKAYLDDYAFMLWACHELYAASLDSAYLVKAKKLVQDMAALFWDREKGGFYFSGGDAEELMIRPKTAEDGAMPSGNSVAARELIRLARLTGTPEYEALANQLLSAFAPRVKQYPAGFTHLLQAVYFGFASGQEVIVLGDWEDEETRQLLTRLQQSFLPEISWLAARNPQDLEEVAPFAAKLPSSAQGSVRICHQYACSLPETDFEKAFNKILEQQSIH